MHLETFLCNVVKMEKVARMSSLLIYSIDRISDSLSISGVLMICYNCVLFILEKVTSSICIYTVFQT